MEFKINSDLVTQVLNVMANAKSTGLSFLETNALIKQLQQLPKIEVDDSPDMPVEEVEKKK